MIEETVRQIYDLLCHSQYAELARVTNGKCLGEAQLSKALSEFGCHLKPYPNEIDLDVVEIMESRPREYNVIAPVYTEEEGLSNLCLELQLIEKQKGQLKAEIDGIHTL